MNESRALIARGIYRDELELDQALSEHRAGAGHGPRLMFGRACLPRMAGGPEYEPAVRAAAAGDPSPEVRGMAAPGVRFHEGGIISGQPNPRRGRL